MKCCFQFPPKEYFHNYSTDPDIKRDMEEVIWLPSTFNSINYFFYSIDCLQMYRQSNDTYRKVIIQLQFKEKHFPFS